MSGLDLSLDDVIAANRKPAAPRGQGARQGSRSAGGRGGGRSALGAGFKQAAVKRGGAPRTTVVAMERDDVWSHDLFNEPQARPAAAAERAPLDIRTGTKLLISNLHPGVTTTDVQELFMMVGPLKQASVNFDQSGRSKGSAEVVFSQRAHALAALSRYNGATLDGQAMSLELVTPAGALKGAVLSSGVAVGAAPPKPRGGGPGAAPQRVVTFAGRAVAAARAAPAPARGVARGGGGRRVGVAGGGAGGRAAGGGRAPKAVASAADLDAELDAYHGAQAQAQGAAGMQE